jgi:hypothetical protein
MQESSPHGLTFADATFVTSIAAPLFNGFLAVFAGTRAQGTPCEEACRQDQEAA